jgi:hypothetical protein
MEKMIYPVWRPAGLEDERFSSVLRGEMSEQLLETGVLGLRVGVPDEAVAPAAGLRQTSLRPGLDAIVSLWVDSANDRARQEEVMARHVGHLHGYLVTESAPIVDQNPLVPGERRIGMSQVVFFRKPPRLDYEHWLEVWLGSHTQVAIETQSTFGYRQNVVTRRLTYGAPEIDAIVEENFPDEAMTSQHAFYDAVGDDDKLDRNRRAMVESCVRFIDFDKIDVQPTSEYVMRSVGS